jgi:hypothetical protein
MNALLVESLKIDEMGAWAEIDGYHISVMTQLGPSIAVEMYPIGFPDLEKNEMQLHDGLSDIENALSKRFPSYVPGMSIWQTASETWHEEE